MTSITLIPRSPQQSAPKLGSVLHVEPDDITFANIRPDLVDIRITVTNSGAESSSPTHAVLSASPLGAFVPWRPLATVPVPRLEPNESFTVQTHARQRRQPLGTPDRVPPRQLLVALGADDNDPPPRRFGTRVARNLVSIFKNPRGTVVGNDTDNRRHLPPNPFDLLSQGNFHWAGN